MDLRCECPGVEGTRRPIQCEREADGEDGLCSECRAHGCPNSPLAWYIGKMDEVMGAGQGWEAMDEIRAEYVRRCAEAQVQP